MNFFTLFLCTHIDNCLFKSIYFGHMRYDMSKTNLDVQHLVFYRVYKLFPLCYFVRISSSLPPSQYFLLQTTVCIYKINANFEINVVLFPMFRNFRKLSKRKKQICSLFVKLETGTWKQIQMLLGQRI